MVASYLGRAVSIPVVGDSNSLIYNGLIFRHEARADVVFAFRTSYLSEFSLLDLVEDGAPSARFREALTQALVISSEHGFVEPHRFPDWERRYDELADLHPDGTTRDDENPVLLVVTHRDFVRALMRLGPAADFELPVVRYGPAAVDEVGTVYPVPLALVEELLAPSFAALTSICRAFADGGFHRVYVLGLRPPSVHDDEMERRWQLPSRALLRYKLTLLINERMRAVCERSGMHFVDCWPLLTTGGVFDERLELDHVHFNREAAVRIASSLVDDFVSAGGAAPER